ncbi:hypothetical protein FRB97_007377 [Tulasnella sp. 331]|nr:hypothetical protein FRB97_007377 [Tulasnella sp. 331]KAG8888500.1 hypothetical protein FRB98_007540 [Tulasnella sp. 332]
MISSTRLTIGLLSAAVSIVALPAPTTSGTCLVIPLGAPAIATAPSLEGFQLTNTDGVATLTTKGYDETFSFAGGGFGAFDACSYYWLDIGGLSPIIPDARNLTWALDSATTATGGTPKTTTWQAAYNSTLTSLGPPTTSTFWACARDTILTSPGTPVVYELFLSAGYIIDPPSPGASVAPSAPGYTCVGTGIFIQPPP